MHATQGARTLVWSLGLLLLSNAVWAQDFDRDGIPDDQDNCLFVVNADQADTDGDGHGNGCECGDFNRDGRVDTTDARLTQRCSIQDIPCQGLCDANGDGACNTTDARLEQRLAVGQLTKAALSCRQRPAAPDVDDDGDGFTELEGDCDDASAEVFPGAPVTTGNPPVPTGCFALRAPVEPPVQAVSGCAGLLESLSDNPTDEIVGAGQCPNAGFGTGDLGNLRACDKLQLCYGTCGRSREACNAEFRESLIQICNNLPAGQDTACQADCLVVAEQYVAAVEQAEDELWLKAQSQACRCCPDRSVPACGDGTCNGSETCGTCAGDCGACPLAARCVVDDECGSGNCGSSGACEEDPCGDGVCALLETCYAAGCQEDCGACPNGVPCTLNADCDSGICNFGFCVGFTLGVGAPCTTDAACSSGDCNIGVCRAVCGDGVCETLEDCGVTSPTGCIDDCGRCVNGSPCTRNDDCTSGICNLGFCIGSPQNNGVPCTTDAACKSGTCRVGFCADLGDPGEPCLFNADCSSGVCNFGFCSSPQELDAWCTTDAACLSGECKGVPISTCQPVCGNGMCEVREESTADELCGSSEGSDLLGTTRCLEDCGICLEGDPCGEDVDCDTGLVCNQGECVPLQSLATGTFCDNDLACISGDCEGLEAIGIGFCAGACGDARCDVEFRESCYADGCQEDCGECPNGTPCTLSTDCDSGICNFGFCIGATQPAGVPCTTDAACDSGACTFGFCAGICGDGKCEFFGDETCFAEGELACQTDCGKCANGTPCTLNADCRSGICNFAFCIGSPLPGSAPCTTDAACQSGACTLGFCETNCGDGKCEPPLETCFSGGPGSCQIDCGACPNGTPCLANADCNSNICNFGFCIGDCLGVGSPCTTDNACCGAGGCSAGICQASCGDGTCSAPLEICGSGTGGLKCQPDCGTCPNGTPCLSGSDCTSGICTAGFCTACKTVGAACTSDAECCVGCAIPPYSNSGTCL